MKNVFLASCLLSASFAFAQVPMQTEQDYASGNRLYINGKPLFISGMNIAWNTSSSFGNDVGDKSLDVNAFTDHIKNVRKAGGNAVRWWLHTDASNCPKINSDGEVTGIGSKTIDNIRTALDIAYEYGVVVSLTLFSFDLLQQENKASYSSYDINNNYKFLTVSANLDTYIEKGLKPILAAVGSHPAIMCWEVFNEPEGMATGTGFNGWSDQKIAHSHIMRFTNKIAGVVHRETKKMASTGIHNFTQYKGVYTDANLKAAGGDDDGYLDFYMAHYYPEYEGNNGPFHNTAASWGFDRPVLIGEFPARSWGPGTPYNYGSAYNIEDAYEYAYNNGYCGAMSWSMTEGDNKFGNYTTTEPALEYMFSKYEDDIKIKDAEIEVLTGDLAMKLAITNLPVLSSDWSELGINKDLNFSGKTNITFEIYIKEGSGTNLDINVVLKTGSGWDWTPGPTLKLSDYKQGEWVTVTVPISSFESSGLSNVKSLLFQYGATASSYSGEIYFDNVKVDGDVISNFDDAVAWSLSADNSAVSIVTRASVGTTTPPTPIIPQTTSPSYSTAIDLKTLDFSKAKIYDMRGKRVFANNSSELKNGVYIVRINGITGKASVSK